MLIANESAKDCDSLVMFKRLWFPGDVQMRKDNVKHIVVVQSESCPTLCDPITAAHQVSLSFTISQSLLKLMSIESVMPSNHLILCCPLLLLPSIFPGIRVFCSELALHSRWPKYWNFSFSISPSNEYFQDWFPLGLTGLISLQAKELSRVFNTTVQKHQFWHSAFFKWNGCRIFKH